jgi:hypothetical protein
MLDARYRTLLILWLAILFSVMLFFVMTRFIGIPVEVEGNMILVPILLALSILTLALSFVLKRRFYSQAIDRQSPAMLQTGLIVALALCEVTALFGLIIFFVTGCHYYYLFFVLSVLGMLLHMPRREPLRAASFKSGGPGFMMQ